jgi:hypothetical protein
MTVAAPVIPRGGSRAAEQAAADKEARSKRSFNDWEYLTLKEAPQGEVYGESVVLRLITDEGDWREVKQHSFINTKSAPHDKPAERKWPVKMGAVCRKSRGFDVLYNDECFICDHMTVEKNGKTRKPYASTRLWAVAVVRDPVIGTQAHVDAGLIEPYQVGKPAFYKDATIEKDEFKDGQPTGKTLKLKKFVVLNFAMENFFDKLLGFNNVYETVVDRDYRVTRKWSGTDTDYEIAPLDPQKVLEGPLAGKKFDLRNPEIAAEYDYTFDLDKIIADQASDEHYEWFFDDRVTSSWEKRFPAKDKKDGESAGPSESSSASKSENDAAQQENAEATLAAMRERMRSNNKK